MTEANEMMLNKSMNFLKDTKNYLSNLVDNLGYDRYLMIDPESGKILTNEENRELMRPDIHTYQKLVNLCAHMTYNPDHAPYNIAVQKCSRQIIGRVLCEFDTTPVIRIKGLCKQSSMDRYFQLIEPKIGEGNYNVF